MQKKSCIKNLDEEKENEKNISVNFCHYSGVKRQSRGELDLLCFTETTCDE